MKFDATDRLEKINEAIVNLFERRSRAAQREAQRTGRGEMTTGRDGNQYPLGADPTRAQPGSALANQPAPQSREDAFLAAQPRMKPAAPAPVARPATTPAARPAAPVAPVAPAPRPASSLMAAGRSVAGSNLNPTTPTSPSLAAGRNVAGYNSGSGTPTTAPSSPGLTDIYKMGSAAFGGEIKTPPSPSAAAAPATSGRQAIQPGSLPQIERQLQSGPSTTQTSPQGKGSLEQDLQSMGGILRNVGLLPSAGGSPKSSTAPAATTSSASAPNFVEATPEERSASASAIARNANQREQMRNAMGGTPSESEQARRDRNAALMDKLNPQSSTPNPNAFRIPQGTPSASGFGAATSPKQPDMESRRAAAATNIVGPQTRERDQLTQQPDMESKRAAAATNIIATQSAQRRNMGGSAPGQIQATPGF